MECQFLFIINGIKIVKFYEKFPLWDIHLNLMGILTIWLFSTIGLDHELAEKKVTKVRYKPDTCTLFFQMYNGV